VNGESTGRTVTNITLENTIIANPINLQDHAFLYMVGDGVSRVTNYNLLLASALSRYPLEKGYADDIEFINCAM
jgi:hypothetical protein